MKRWLIAAAVLTVAVSVMALMPALADQPLFRFGVPGQWIWRSHFSPYGDRAWIGLIAAGLLGLLCHWTREHVVELRGGRLAIFLVMAGVLCLSLQASFPYLSRSGFGQGIFWMGTPKMNADFADARRAESLGAVLRESQDPTRPFRVHLSTHPPGPVVFYFVQERIWQRAPAAAARFAALVESILPSAAESRGILEDGVLRHSLTQADLATLYGSILLMWLVTALGVVPLYFWAAKLFSPATAVVAIGFYALIPSLLIFNPMTDQLYPPLALTILAMVHLGLARRDPVQLALAGCVTWIALQFTLAFLVVVLVVGVYVCLAAMRERRILDTFKLLAWSAGAVLALVLLGLTAGYNCLVAWKLCLSNNALFNASRTYWPWLLYNPLDFAMFLGLPVAVFFARGAGAAVARRAGDAPGWFTIALLGTLVVLNVSGTNRGEVARLWMFLMPMAAAVAAHSISEPVEKKDWAFPICYGLLFVQSVLFKISFDVLLPPVSQ